MTPIMSKKMKEIILENPEILRELHESRKQRIVKTRSNKEILLTSYTDKGEHIIGIADA